MLQFLVEAASLMRSPIPRDVPDPRAVFSPDDMPAYVQIQGINRFIPTRTTIRPDGTLQDCGVERSSGDPKLDTYTCAIILKRAKFESAHWTDGSPAYAVVRFPVKWIIGESPSQRTVRKALPADIELSVNKLPSRADNPTIIRVAIAVDENGRVLDCKVAGGVSNRDAEARFPQLVPIACAQMTDFTAVPARDSSGHPVRSVQDATVSIGVVQ